MICLSDLNVDIGTVYELITI